MKVPVVGAYSPYSLTVRNAGDGGVRRLERLQVHGHGDKAYKTLAKRYLRTFPQNEFFEDDALAGYAYVKIVAEAIRKVGANPAEDRGLRPCQHLQHPRLRVPAAVDAVG